LRKLKSAVSGRYIFAIDFFEKCGLPPTCIPIVVAYSGVIMKRIIVVTLMIFSLGMVLLSGCGHTPEGGSPLPWARPEPWEGQFKGAPGMAI